MRQLEMGPYSIQSGAVVLGDEINHLVGTTPLLIAASTDARQCMLVVSAERGNFRIAQGDRISAPPGEFPGASVNDGSGWMLLPEGAAIPFPMPETGRMPFSLVGFAADSVASYWFA